MTQIVRKRGTLGRPCEKLGPLVRETPGFYIYQCTTPNGLTIKRKARKGPRMHHVNLCERCREMMMKRGNQMTRLNPYESEARRLTIGRGLTKAIEIVRKKIENAEALNHEMEADHQRKVLAALLKQPQP